MHRLSDSFEISVLFAFVPDFFGPDSYLSSATDEYDVLVYLCVLRKLFVKYDSAVCVGNTFLSYTKKELLYLKRYRFGKLLDFVNLDFPILSGINGEVGIKFSCDVELFAKVLAELRGDEHTVFRIERMLERANE